MRGPVFFLLFLPMVSPHNSTIERGGRFFFIFTPFFRVPVVTPSACSAVDGREGVCYTNARCRTLELTPAGSCTSASGVCCIASKTCGQTSSSSVTYFRNPTGLPTRCTLRIQKVNSTITQLRLDFTQFSLSQPQNGKCTNFLMLSQTDTTQPKICGENSGSHVYVNFDPLCDDHTLQFTFGDTSSSDQWNIKITQIPNDSDLKAPTGCLMFYPNSVSGTITSFNFGQATDTDTRQLSPLNYGICIRPLVGYCQIKWTGNDLSMTTDSACQRSYLEIPCSVPDTGGVALGDRYCTIIDFPNPSSACRPYVVYVVTNTDEADAGTTGFKLNFQQQAC